MMGFWLRNLGFYSLQIAVILLLGGAALKLLRIRLPICRLLLWQALLAAALVVPLTQPYSAPTETGVAISTASTGSVVGQGPVTAAIPFTGIAAITLMAGTAARFGFLFLGFYRLRRFRLASAQAPSAAAQDLQRRMGVTAEIRVLDTIPGPVTFGLFYPVVIVPSRWLDNESILCHELIHVKRRDWLTAAAEEFIRAAFWFHPLVWWTIAQIQLAREQVVDREVLAITAAPARYLETLLEIAAAKSGLELAPAPLFLRSRHLRQRVASLLKEVHMSKKRLTFSTAGFCVTVAAAAWCAVHAFPLQAAPQQETSGIAVTHRVQPEYPAIAKQHRIQGEVAIKVHVDEQGLVSDAQVIGGPEELQQAALTAVRQWTFTKSAQLPAVTDVQISFRLQDGIFPPSDGVQRIRVGGNVQSANLITKIHPIYPPEAKAAGVQGRVRLNVLVGEDGAVKDVVLIEGEQVLADAAIPAVRQWVYHPTLLNGQPAEVVTVVDVNFTLLP